MKNLLLIIPILLLGCKKESHEQKIKDAVTKFGEAEYFSDGIHRLDSLRILRIDTLTDKDNSLIFLINTTPNYERLADNSEKLTGKLKLYRAIGDTYEVEKLKSKLEAIYDSVDYYTKIDKKAKANLNFQDSTTLRNFRAIFIYKGTNIKNNTSFQDTTDAIVSKDYKIIKPKDYIKLITPKVLE